LTERLLITGNDNEKLFQNGAFAAALAAGLPLGRRLWPNDVLTYTPTRKWRAYQRSTGLWRAAEGTGVPQAGLRLVDQMEPRIVDLYVSEPRSAWPFAAIGGLHLYARIRQADTVPPVVILADSP